MVSITIWHDGDGVKRFQKFNGGDSGIVISFPGNKLLQKKRRRLQVIPTFRQEPGWLYREDRANLLPGPAPFITRENPAVASIYGPGACEAVMDGPVGSGVFIWPTTETWISGYDYSPETNHRAIVHLWFTWQCCFCGGCRGFVVYAVGLMGFWKCCNDRPWKRMADALSPFGLPIMFNVDTMFSRRCNRRSRYRQGILPVRICNYEMRYNGVAQNPHNFYNNYAGSLWKRNGIGVIHFDYVIDWDDNFL